MTSYSLRESGQMNPSPVSKEYAMTYIGNHIMSGGKVDRVTDRIWHLNKDDETVAVVLIKEDI